MSDPIRRPFDLLLSSDGREADTLTQQEIVLRDLEDGIGQPCYRAWLHRCVDRMEFAS